MKQFKWLPAACLLAIIVITTVLPMPVKAAVPTITGVSPQNIVNNINNAITIDGTNFTNLSEVSVGSTKVEVTSFSALQLIVRIPAGFAPGDYSITISNPGTPPDVVILPNILHVTAPQVSGRPQIVIDVYSLSVTIVRYNQDFTVNVSLDNAGGSTAYGMQVIFSSADFIMLNNGGIIAAGSLGVVGKNNISQTMTAAHAFTDVNRSSVDMTVSYTDDKGTAYSDKFNLGFPVVRTGPATTPTFTPHPLQNSQLVITNYDTDVVPLQPGFEFTLSVSVQNVGNLTAKGVTMIVGGGSASGGSSGTPAAGGINGGSGEFSNFAPVGSSNLQSLGDFVPGASLTARQKLIVNVSANPGAYPFKISFAYTDANGNVNTDDQVITLLIYSLPNLDVSFYQPVGDFSVGTPGALPLQVTSLGKRTAVLGKMIVTMEGGMVSNGEALIGNLDPGGYFTLDSMVTPNQAGPLDLTISIEYTDDFNKLQTITKTLSVNVMDIPVMPTPDINNPGDGGIITPVNQQTTWQKVWRFILGLFGLDSSAPSNTVPDNSIPTEIPIPIPIKGGGGKG
jgi:hypothetical protein